MDIKSYQNVFHSLAPETVFAGQYLEHRGLRFGSEFGTSDAVKKATVRILMALEESEHYGHAI